MNTDMKRKRLKGEGNAVGKVEACGRWRLEAMECGSGNAECGKLKLKAQRLGS